MTPTPLWGCRLPGNHAGWLHPEADPAAHHGKPLDQGGLAAVKARDGGTVHLGRECLVPAAVEDNVLVQAQFLVCSGPAATRTPSPWRKPGLASTALMVAHGAAGLVQAAASSPGG